MFETLIHFDPHTWNVSKFW